jgi:hypothetical protein
MLLTMMMWLMLLDDLTHNIQPLPAAGISDLKLQKRTYQVCILI